MNTAIGDNLYLGVLLGLYIQVFLLGIIIVLGSRGKTRIVILGSFCYLMAASTLYNIFWPTFNTSFIANFFLAGFKDTYLGPILFLYIILLSQPKNRKRLILGHLIFPTMVTCTYLVFKFGFGPYYPQHYARLATFFLIIKTFSFLFYIVLMWMNRHKMEMVIPSLRKKYFVFFYLIMTYAFVTSVMSILSVYIEWFAGAFEKLNTFVYAPMGFITYFITIIFAISENNYLKNFFILKSPYISKEVVEMKTELGLSLEGKLLSSKGYKDPYLSTKKVAKLLGVHQDILVEYIRIHHKKSFNEFLTDLRIEEFKRICGDQNHKNLSISGMAYEAGFKSKATFYRLFKQRVGISPGTFIAQKGVAS
ncbi:MAG: AraC family transcriptional regulator [Bacteroidota bacterium]